MTREEYLSRFERWVGGGKGRKARLRDELDEHLAAAESAGELNAALQRLGDPRAAAAAFTEGSATSPAPLPRRFFAAVVDMFVFVALAAGGLAAATWAAVERNDGIFPEDLTFGTGDGSRYMTSIGWLGVSLLVAAALWWIVVTPILEWRTGRTLGKAALGLRVLAEDGTAPGLGQIVVRRLTLVFSGPLQLFDWGFVFFNPKRQRAFDILAKTIVVEDDRTAANLVPATSPMTC